MKLCTFHHGETTHLGVVTDDGVGTLLKALPGVIAPPRDRRPAGAPKA